MTVKKSYTVPCATAFRDTVEALAERSGVNVADIARSVMLLAPREVIEAMPDPGEPPRDDRESVVLKSGPSAGRPWRRKPRLQVRMPSGLEIASIRRALALAVELDQGKRRLSFDGSGTKPAPEPAAKKAAEPAKAQPAKPEPARTDPKLIAHMEKQQQEIDRLRGAINALSFEPLPFGVRSRADALFVLGFRPGSRPDRNAVRGRLRTLAAVHHPDSPSGDHERMAQVNAAVAFLTERT
jgi:hypothetical protein